MMLLRKSIDEKNHIQCCFKEITFTINANDRVTQLIKITKNKWRKVVTLDVQNAFNLMTWESIKEYKRRAGLLEFS